MGGASSKFNDTDWDTVDGGLKEASETIDGQPPTSHHSILTLAKHSVVNQREYDIRDDQDILLYTTKAVQGTTKWFDFLGKSNQRLFRVQTDMLRQSWDIFVYSNPAFPGQQPDPKATENAGEPLYRKAKIIITWDKHHGFIYLYGPSTEEPDPIGVVKEKDALLKVEEVRSITAQYQSFVPKGIIDVPHPSLSGHWVWENTVKTHKMKMHLAKGTDVALNCIASIVTNMIRLERNVGGALGKDPV